MFILEKFRFKRINAVLLALAVAITLLSGGCHPSLRPLPNFSGTTFLTESNQHFKVLTLSEPNRSWSIASLWIPLAPQPETHGLAHLLEHLLLRRLRQHGCPFFIAAASCEHWIYFNCVHLPPRLPQALALLRQVFKPPALTMDELDQIMAVLAHERAIRSQATIPIAVDLPQRLQRLHRRYFASDQAFLLVLSPYSRKQVLAEVKTSFSSTGTRLRISLPAAPWRRPDGLAKIPRQLLLIGPPLHPGELPYFKLLLAWFDRCLTASSRATWRIDWQISPADTMMVLRPQEAITDNWSEDLSRVLDLICDTPPPAQDFATIQVQLLHRYYLALADPEQKIFALGKAQRAGYLRDLLGYPLLLQQADRRLFFEWSRRYLALARPHGDFRRQWRQIIDNCAEVPAPTLAVTGDFSCFPSYRGASEIDFHPDQVITIQMPQRQWAALAWCSPITPAPSEWLSLCSGGQSIYYCDGEQLIAGVLLPRLDCQRRITEWHRCRQALTQQALRHYLSRQSPLARRLYHCQQQLLAVSKGQRQIPECSLLQKQAICLVAGDFPTPVLTKWGKILQQNRAMATPAPILDRSALSPKATSTKRYLLAAVPLTHSSHQHFSGYHTLALYLNDLMYRQIILPGDAYQAHAFYQPMLTQGILGLWVATTPAQAPRLRRLIEKMLARATRTTIAPRQFATLQERACLHFLRSHDQNPQALPTLIQTLAASYRYCGPRNKFRIDALWHDCDADAFRHLCQYLAPSQWLWSD